jgi:YHS domain-containing protein
MQRSTQARWNKGDLLPLWKKTAADAELVNLGEGLNLPKDPVCRMEVSLSHTPWAFDGNGAKYKSTYKGAVYRFCSDDCKARFDKNPTKYVK